ncbi:MAG: 5'-nucleotidase [Burkholderiaceae bacterium]
MFLSANGADVAQALALGHPAAQVATQAVRASDAHPGEVRIAFDGDAVLFSDEAERVFQSDGLDAFQSHEVEKADLPLQPGPFQPFLAALHRLQLAGGEAMRVRTALVTARSAPANERPIKTLMQWGVAVDEAMFLGGLPKGEFLREFQPDFFFDDQTGHIEHARDAGRPRGRRCYQSVGGPCNSGAAGGAPRRHDPIPIRTAAVRVRRLFRRRAGRRPRHGDRWRRQGRAAGRAVVQHARPQR